MSTKDTARQPVRRRGLDELKVYLDAATGRWVAPVRRPGQRPLKIYGATEQEAFDNRKAYYDDVARGLRHPDGSTGRMGDRKIVTVGDWMDCWIESVKPVYDKTGRRVGGVEPSTYQNRINHLKHILHPKLGLGRIKLTSLTITQVREWYYDSIKAGAGSVSMQYSHATLVNALNEALRNQAETHLTMNAAALCKVEKAGVKEKPWPDRVSVERIIAEAAGDRHELAMHLGFRLGLRRQELCALQGWDFDMDRGELHIRRRVNRFLSEVIDPALQQATMGHHGPRKGLLVRPGVKMKRDRQEDILPIDPEEWRPLLAQHRQRALEFYARRRTRWTGLDPREERAFLFTNDFGEVMDPQRLFEWCKTIFRKAGVSEKTVHGLRHDFAGILHLMGVDLTDRSRLLRHANTAVTDAVYTHVSDDRKREMIAKASAWMTRSAEGS